jgi:two-component system C4-dicarboxylate transport sensor histidine kinase DctB
MVERISKPNPDLVTIKRYAVDVVRMSDRIAQIIKVLRAVSREGSNDPMELISIQQIIDNCIMLCSTKYFANKVELMVTNAPPSLKTECRPVEIEQVLLNSLYNAFDAASKQDDKWVKIDILDQGGFIEVMITDSGAGIPEDIREKKLSAVLHYERSGQRGWARTQRRTGHLSKPQR